MKELVFQEILRRYKRIDNNIKRRVERELDVIMKRDYAKCILAIADVIYWARSTGMAIGPGAGAVGGSIIAYALGITEIDPLRYGLLFERFINPDMCNALSVDIKICIVEKILLIDFMRMCDRAFFANCYSFFQF